MAHTLTVLTLRLAEAIGLYCLAAGIGMLTAPTRWRAILDDIERIPGLTYAFGAVAFAVGVAILIAHHVTHDPLGLIVTIIAACAAIEGLVLIAAPTVFIAIARSFLAAPRLWAIISIVLGIFLFLAGFTGHADALP